MRRARTRAGRPGTPPAAPPRKRAPAAPSGGVLERLDLDADRAAAAYTDFESLEIYGQPNDELREWIERVREGVPFTLHETHWGGFTRLSATN